MKFREDFRRVRCEHHALDMQLLIWAPWDSMLTGGLPHAHALRSACGTASKPHAMAC